MKKSKWITFCGWAALGLVLFGLCAPIVSRENANPPIVGALAALSLVLAVPAFGLWLLASALHRFRVQGARIKAHALVEAGQKSAVMGAPVPAIAPAAARSAQGSSRHRCTICQEPHAVVRCEDHAVLLCSKCWGQHHNAGVCHYAQVDAGVALASVAEQHR